MHDARAVVDGHEVVGHHAERVALDRDERERRLVAGADQLAGRDLADHRRVVAEHGLDAIARHHEVASALGARTRT